MIFLGLENKEVVMELFGMEFIVKEDLKNLNYIRKSYEGLADELASDWLEAYGKYSSMEDLLKVGREDIYRDIFKGLDRAVDILIENGVLHINEDVFFEKYYRPFFSMEDYIGELEDEYLAISMDQAQMDAYRTARREHRSKWSGGGFGVQGAMKGALTAGGLNMVGGAAHGAFNLVGKAFDSMGNSLRRDELLNSQKTRQRLYQGLRLNIFQIHRGLAAAFEDLTNIRVRTISREDSDQAQGLLDNLSRPNIDGARKQEMVYEILDRDPYIAEVYSRLLKLYPDQLENIYQIADYFGIAGFKDYIYNLVKEDFRKAGDGIDLCNRQEVARLKEALIHRLNRLGLRENNPEFIGLMEEFEGRVAGAENLAIREAYKALDLDSIRTIDDFKLREEEFKALNKSLEGLDLELEEATKKVIAASGKSLNAIKKRVFQEEMDQRDYGPDLSQAEEERLAGELAEDLDLDIDASNVVASGLMRSWIKLLKKTGIYKVYKKLNFDFSTKKARRRSFLKIGGIFLGLSILSALIFPEEDGLELKGIREEGQKVEEERLADRPKDQKEDHLAEMKPEPEAQPEEGARPEPEPEVVEPEAQVDDGDYSLAMGVKSDDFEINIEEDLIGRYNEGVANGSIGFIDGNSLIKSFVEDPEANPYSGRIVGINSCKVISKSNYELRLVATDGDYVHRAHIICNMEYSQDSDRVQLGDRVEIIGYCTGYGEDISITRAILL